MNTERSVITHKELFNGTIKNLITLIFIKLGKFDRFFNNFTITIHDETIENSLEKFLKTFSIKLYSGYEAITVTFNYSDFINPFGNNKLNFKIIAYFTFESNQYGISLSIDKKISYNKPYTEQLSPDLINLIADNIAEYVYSRIYKTLNKEN
ncbi:MAG: hypothetical protein HY738_09005 [Bacteroidia bacterium]|nr:hypothetical protein [Bacteroidia bacterium]